MGRESIVINLSGKKIRAYKRNALDVFALDGMKEQVESWSGFIVHEHNAIIVRDALLARWCQWYHWPIRFQLKRKYHKRKFLKYPPREIAKAAYEVCRFEGDDNLTLKVLAGLADEDEKKEFDKQIGAGIKKTSNKSKKKVRTKKLEGPVD